MIALGLRIPQKQAEPWLEELVGRGMTVELEVGADIFRDGGASQEVFARQGLQVLCVRDIVDAQLGRYLEDVGKSVFDQAVNGAVQALETAREYGARVATLDLGFDRMARDDSGESLTSSRVALLRKLIPVAEDSHISLCSPVRVPPEFPGSREMQVAANLIHDAEIPHFRAALNLFPGELDRERGLKEVSRHATFLSGLIRIHYPPMGDDEMDPDWVRALVAELNWNGYEGGIVFCPEECELGKVGPACEYAGEMLELARMEISHEA